MGMIIQSNVCDVMIIELLIKIYLFIIKGLPCSSIGKESACSAGDPGLIPGLGRSPREANDNLLQYPCLEKSHG